MLYINDGDKLSLSTKNFNQNTNMKNNQNNVVAIFEKMVAAMPASWTPSTTEICEAWIASQTMFPKGIFPSEYKGDAAKGAFAPLVTLTALCEATKVAVRKAIAWVAETATKAFSMVKSLYKGRRHREELEKWLCTNPKGFVIAWHPLYRSYDKVAEWCGEDEAKRLFGL
jgi:hypothetical protein